MNISVCEVPRPLGRINKKYGQKSKVHPAMTAIEYPYLAAQVEKYKNPVAVTLTLKQARKLFRVDLVTGAKTFTGEFETIDEAKAQKTLSRFLTRLSRKVLPRKAIRAGKKVANVSVLERSAAGRLHFHLFLDLAQDAPASIIQEAWAKQPFGHEQIDVQAACDSGWLKYILKGTDTHRSVPGISWENFSSI